ncbi:hypothetical protein SeMB42_g00410 [Synchytrium endobioticum]|uniref:Ribokinase n=1 Tax=Synchytrium endobioticum TaxID=286115 RepID=A0A507DTC2_9FUNG|nr:hypothetical protein SeLEV6574_g02562 [Synchytrium endobioticum]TPX54198.1 hypothetical protein SeMB42_g00410 [Synchytrium endobioticum]
MPNVLTYGSINIDDIFLVDDIIKPGETISALNYTVLAGGKGANQSVALAKASQGSNVTITHAGNIGEDGKWILKLMEDAGVDTSLVTIDATVRTGRAIIQVSKTTGNNSIILYAGANKSIHQADAERILSQFHSNNTPTWLVLQNEISSLDFIIPYAYRKGYTIAFNTAPCPIELVSTIPIKECHILIMNESEAASVARQLLNVNFEKDLDISNTEIIGKRLFDVLPSLRLAVVTLGSQGSVAIYSTSKRGNLKTARQPALSDVEVVDTTGAGDVFIGYFLTELSQGWHGTEAELNDKVVSKALTLATTAAGIACESCGAMGSVPLRDVVIQRTRSVEEIF